MHQEHHMWFQFSNESLGALIKFQIKRTEGHDFLLKIQEMFLHFFLKKF